jgi:hypothetical protein
VSGTLFQSGSVSVETTSFRRFLGSTADDFEHSDRSVEIVDQIDRKVRPVDHFDTDAMMTKAGDPLREALPEVKDEG